MRATASVGTKQVCLVRLQNYEIFLQTMASSRFSRSPTNSERLDLVATCRNQVVSVYADIADIAALESGAC